MTAIEAARGDLESMATTWEAAAERHLSAQGADPQSPGWMLGIVRALTDLSRPWAAYDPAVLAERAHVRVLLHPAFDAWLLAWPTSGRTDLHDHGGAAGAFAVIDGELVETWLAADRLHARVLESGAAVAFGANHIHDVVNARLAPATSVHVYAPPISSMTHYSRDDLGRPTPCAVEDVRDLASAAPRGRAGDPV